MGRSIRSNSLTQFDRISFRIGKVSNQYHDKVYQSPNTATATSKQLSDTRTNLAYIKTMHSKSTKKEAQQQHYEPFFTFIFTIELCSIYRAATFYTNDSIVIYFCTTILTKHNNNI